MSILNKIHINKLTYLVIVLSIFTGQFRLITCTFFIIIFHEFGHIIASQIFKWKIEKINIYPFGGYIKYNISLNENILKEMIVTICGPLFQLIITLILTNISILSGKEIVEFKNISYSLLLFNLLPIVPLDGSKIIFLIYNKFTSYNKSHIFLIYTSLLFIILLFVNNVYNFTFQAVIIFLIISIINEYKNHNSIINKFLLERFLHNYNNKKIKLLYKINPKLIWKEKNNIFVDSRGVYSEKEILSKYFKR